MTKFSHNISTLTLQSVLILDLFQEKKRASMGGYKVCLCNCWVLEVQVLMVVSFDQS